MSFLVDIEYIDKLSLYVKNFKYRGDYLWNFRCPFCGDSRKKTSSHGYIFKTDQDEFIYKCHKCIATNLPSLLKEVSPDLYKDYRRDTFKETISKKPRTWKDTIRETAFHRREKWVNRNPLKNLQTISDLPEDHPARQYIVSRRIPDHFHKVLLYTDDFAKVIDNWFPSKYVLKPEPRIIIPFRDGKGNLLAIQGRDLAKESNLRYITIKDKSAAPKIFGLDRISQAIHRIYVLEGPFDSMFLPNALACAGSDLPKMLPRNRCIVVYDNEPRNGVICDKIEKAIGLGFTVCLFPKWVRQKDINDMIVKGGFTSEELIDIIERNSYAGHVAKIKLRGWREDA